MNKLAQRKVFVDNGCDREREDLSYTLFDGLDYELLGVARSFMRSDFTRSSFINSTFFKNNFDRADFIDSDFEDCTFRDVIFGCCLIENAMFTHVTFEANKYRGTDMRNAVFQNCTFQNECVIAGMTECIFISCTFTSYSVEKSTMSKNTFLNCTFTNVDMAECIAENSSFANCIMVNVSLCATHWATYFFRNVDLNSVDFKYRGRLVNVWERGSSLGFSSFLGKGLYFEYINALTFIGAFAENERFPAAFKAMLEESVRLPDRIRRKTILNLIEVLQQYMGTDLINYTSCEYALSVLDTFLSSQSFPFDELLEYRGAEFTTKLTYDQVSLDMQYALTAPSSSRVAIELRLAYSSKDEAVAYSKKLFTNCAIVAGLIEQDEIFELRKVTKGSIVLTIASFSILAALISCAAKRCATNINHTRVEWTYTSKGVDMLKQAETPEQLNEIMSNLKREPADTYLSQDDTERLSELVTKGEIISMIISPLESIFRQ